MVLYSISFVENEWGKWGDGDLCNAISYVTPIERAQAKLSSILRKLMAHPNPFLLAHLVSDFQDEPRGGRNTRLPFRAPRAKPRPFLPMAAHRQTDVTKARPP